MASARYDDDSGSRPPLLVWVLVPTIETDDANISYYNDFSDGHAEFSRAFAELGLDWRWQPVTMRDYREVIDTIAASADVHTPLVFNLCDGDETNGSPGLSVIHCLDEAGLTYTGADARFYEVTTSKIVMKELFDRAGVPTAPWEVLKPTLKRTNGLFKRLGAPLILKPAISAGSMGITTRSVVGDEAGLLEQLKALRTGYHGWDLLGGGVFVERFVTGPEYTTFIVGSHEAPEQRIVYPPVERVFHRKLPPTERFLSFDRLWEMYEQESPVGEGEDLWTYQQPPAALVPAICEISWAAYAAVGGTGYGRVDLRQDERTGELYVLEVNAQCGLSEDENYTSIGAMLRFDGSPYSRIVQVIIDEALSASGVPASTRT